jgi:hypothetical protein
MKISFEIGTKSSQYGLYTPGYTHVTIIDTMRSKYVNMSKSLK